MVKRRSDSTYWDDPEIEIMAEGGHGQLLLQCYEYGVPWNRDESNAVLEARLRKAGVKLPEEETLEELQERAAKREG